MDENTTPDALADAENIPAAAAPGTVEKIVTDDLSLSELNAFLGKDFKTKDSALKAVKDTFSYVGKKKEDIEKEVLAKVSNTTATDALAKEIENMRKDMFYKDNPQYAGLRTVIEKVGGNPAEVVNQDWFKETHSKVSGYDESQKLRTVLDSNPRLASTKDAFSKAKELQSQGGSKEQVEALVVRGVLDSMQQ